MNAKDRKLALSWLETKPLPHLLLMAMALDPLDRLLHEHFRLGSREWETQQRAGVAQDSGSGTQGQRLYRVQLAADGTLENRFLNSLNERFFKQDFWDVIPPDALTVKFNTLAFRVLARMGLFGTSDIGAWAPQLPM